MTPILLIHNGKQLYYKCCLKHNRQYNSIVTINSEEDSSLFEDLSNGNKELNEFITLYKHMSTNPEWIERLCFYRYFLANEYAKRFNIDQFWIIDSDVLIFENLSQDLDFYDLSKLNKSAAFSIPKQKYSDLSWSASPHISLWSRDSIDSFTRFITTSYKNNISELMRKYRNHVLYGLKGGICDMTLLYLWSQNNNVLNLSIEHRINGYLFDNNINSLDNYDGTEFKSYFGCKSIKIIKGKLYAESSSNILIKVISLHFQGRAKKLLILFTIFKTRYIFCVKRLLSFI